ncbi:unnamed protein product [Camellia sinensis]
MPSRIVVGVAYNLLQTPFAADYAIRGKRLINHHGILHFDFYGDKEEADHLCSLNSQRLPTTHPRLTTPSTHLCYTPTPVLSTCAARSSEDIHLCYTHTPELYTYREYSSAGKLHSQQVCTTVPTLSTEPMPTPPKYFIHQSQDPRPTTLPKGLLLIKHHLEPTPPAFNQLLCNTTWNPCPATPPKDQLLSKHLHWNLPAQNTTAEIKTMNKAHCHLHYHSSGRDRDRVLPQPNTAHDHHHSRTRPIAISTTTQNIEQPPKHHQTSG